MADSTAILVSIWWSRPFPSKKSPHKFSETNSSHHIISWFFTLWATFFTTKAKTTHFTTLKTFLTVFQIYHQISPYFVWSTLKSIWYDILTHQKRGKRSLHIYMDLTLLFEAKKFVIELWGSLYFAQEFSKALTK